MPKFSVIIPIYNAEKYLHRCIDSVLKQTYTDFEVILVDDGSLDSCPTICDEYAKKDNRVKVIHKKNAGVSLARQDGIAVAQGEYLVFVDADDRVTDWFFDVISKYTYVDIIRFGCIVEHSNGTLLNRFPKEKAGFYEKSDIEKNVFPYLIQSKFATYYCPSLWRHVFKKDLFVDNMVKDKIIKIGEDGACVIPCVYNAKSLFCINECIYIYNYNDMSATKARNVFRWDDPMLIYQHLNEKINANQFDFQSQIYRKIVHELFLTVVSQFNRNESYRSIVMDIKKHICSDIYSECIKKAEFKSLNGRLMTFSLKYRLFWLIKLFHTVKFAKQKRNMG